MNRRHASLPTAATWFAIAVATTALVPLAALAGGPPDDPADRAIERAQRDAERAAERASRDDARFAEERARIRDDAADDATRAVRDEARLQEDRQEDLIRQQEQAAKDQEDYLKNLAKAQEDLADELADAAEDAAEDVDDYGSSEGMRDLAGDERPEYDDRGYPVRRGEVVALDLAEAQIAEAQRQGFKVIGRERLESLGAEVTRLSVPDAMTAAEALSLARRIAPDAAVDLVHYYGMLVPQGGPEGSGSKGEMRRREGRLTIGMIDTGVVGHPALRGTSIEVRDFSEGKGGVPTAHGTAIASILSSEGSSKIFVANIFRGDSSRPHTTADSLALALEWMVANRVPVVNISLSGPRNAILDRLVQRTIANGTVIVAAAGNGGPTAPPAYPAALSNVIAVTAVDRNNRVYRYANQGRHIVVAARGVDEPAARPGGGIVRYSGTSFATPHVAAWMARCMGGRGAGACTASLRREARDLGEPGYDPVYGYGLVE